MLVILNNDFCLRLNRVCMRKHPVGNQGTVAHMRLLDVLTQLYAHQLRHSAVHQLLIVLRLIGFFVRSNTQLHQLLIRHIIQREQIGTGFFKSRTVFFEIVLGHSGHQLSRSVSQALMQIHVHITHQSTVFLSQFALHIREHEFFVETVTLCSLIIGFGQVFNRHRFRTVVLANPIGIGQVDTDRRSRIASSGKDRSGDHFGRYSTTFRFFVLFSRRRIIFKPLRIGRQDTGALGGGYIFEVNHRLPGTGDA